MCLFHQIESHFIHELRIVQVVKLDVVADFWNLANVVLSIFLVVVILYLLPAFELYQVWLAITLLYGILNVDIHTDACCNQLFILIALNIILFIDFVNVVKLLLISFVLDFTNPSTYPFETL